MHFIGRHVYPFFFVLVFLNSIFSPISSAVVGERTAGLKTDGSFILIFYIHFLIFAFRTLHLIQTEFNLPARNVHNTANIIFKPINSKHTVSNMSNLILISIMYHCKSGGFYQAGHIYISIYSINLSPMFPCFIQ